MKKIPVKLSGCGEYRAIKKQLKNIIYESLHVDEFEQKWQWMIEDFGLSENSWLRSLYEIRTMWVLVYLKNRFWAGMSTTQRSESMNAFFDRYVNAKTTLKMFVAQYDSALRNKTEKEDKADFNCFHTILALVSDQHVEKQFAEVYTHDIMRKFQVELKGISNCNVQNVTSDGIHTTTYEVTEFVLAKDKITRNPVLFTVDINDYASTIDCLFSLFNFKGIVCRHMLFAMNIHGMHTILDTYILRRWRKDIRRRYTLIACSRDDRKTNPRMKNFDSIMKDAASIGELASYSSERTSWVKSQFKKIKDKLSGAITSFIGDVSCTSSKSIGILSPHKRSKRGRPPTTRLKSTIEKYGKSTRKGKGKGKANEVDADIVPETQPSTPRAMSEDQNIPMEIILARMSVPEFNSQTSQMHYDDFDPKRFSYSSVFCQSDNTESA